MQSKRTTGKLSYEKVDGVLTISWRVRFSFLTFVGLLIPFGLVINLLLELVGLSHKPISGYIIVLLLSIAAVILFFDYFFRSKKMIISSENLKFRSSAIPIPGLTVRNYATSQLKKAEIKQKLVSSGIEDGVGYTSVDQQIIMTTKDSKQRKLVAGLTETEAKFVLNAVRKVI